MMDKGEVLRAAAVFAGVPRGTIDQLCSRCSDISFNAGERLFERGQEARELKIVQRGTVELFFPVVILGATRELILERKEPGDVVAWSALISPHQFTVSARCATPCTLIGFDRDDLLQLFESDPQLGYLFMRNLAVVVSHRLQNMLDIWIHELQTSAAKRME